MINLSSMNETKKWQTIGFDTTHIKDENDTSLYGKAICGTRFAHFSVIVEVEEGTKVNCARCLVKVGWAKKIGNSGMASEKKVLGYSETLYELIKDLDNASLKIKSFRNGKTFNPIGTIFSTSTEHRR